MPEGRYSRRGGRTLAAALIIIGAACSGGAEDNEQDLSSDSPSPADAAQADSMIAGAMQQLKETEMARFPCSLFRPEEMTGIAGVPVDSGSYTFVNRSEDNIEWKSEACAWSRQEDMNTVVDVWVSLPAHFPSGKVECHPLTGEPEVPGIGKSAWWQYYDGYGLGTLRVCSDSALMEVKVDKGKSASEAQTQETARKVAEEIMGRLPAAGG